MKDKKELTYMASMYMALADKTRLRLLDMMSDGEICVGSFTDALGLSQPKISRHLAYLRNAGIVDARRDGKWIHYSIHWPDDPGGRGLLRAALAWVSDEGGTSLSDTQPGVTRRANTADSSFGHHRPGDIYAEPDIIQSDISESEYEAHNELDDFLL